MISLGGKVKGANIEVHDVQFAAAEGIDDTIELVKASWYGEEKKLHMDSFKKITGADGYRVEVVKHDPKEEKKLFFLHVGGYDKDMTQEMHRAQFVVAETPEEAKKRGFKEAEDFGENGHVDQVVYVQECILAEDGEKYFISLQKSGEEFNMKPDWFGYRRLDRE